MVGLAKSREHRTTQTRDQCFERLWLQLVDLPLALCRGAVPHHGCADWHLGRVHQRMAPGLAIAGDHDPVEVGGLVLLERRDGRLDQFNRLRIAHVVAAVAGVEHALIGMLEEKIGRQHGKSVARAAHRLVLGVLHQAISLVHEDDGRKFFAAGGIGQEPRHSVVADDLRGGDVDMPTGDVHMPLRSSRHPCAVIPAERSESRDPTLGACMR